MGIQYQKTELAPCPFCGKQPELVEVYEYTSLHNGGWCWMVRCNFLNGGCGAKGPGRASKEEAVALWQKRCQEN